MGIIDMHVLMAALVLAIVAWSRSLGRRWPIAVALGTLAVEIGVQGLAMREIAGATAVDSGNEAAQIARGLALGLNAGAIELATLLIVLGTLAGIAVVRARSRRSAPRVTR